MYFLIAGWGHERRGYAAGKFFLYTLGASAFLFVGILALVVDPRLARPDVTTFDVRALAHTHLSGTAGVLLFLAFTAAFAVKAPIFPFHTWSPDAYREAPAAGSMLLAGVMAKLGTYGIIRFDLALFPARGRHAGAAAVDASGRSGSSTAASSPRSSATSSASSPTPRSRTSASSSSARSPSPARRSRARCCRW